MAILHGKLGKVNGQSTVAEWEIEYFGEPPPWVTSQTQSGQAHACGPYDWNGWFRAYGHTPNVFPGDALNFAGDFGNGFGVSGTAIVDELDIVCDIEKALPLQYFVRFSRNGVLSKEDVSATDSSTPAIYCPTALIVKLNGVSQTDTRYWRLVLRCDNAKYITSETGSGYQRVAGIINGQWVYRVYHSNASTLPVEGGNYSGDFYVTDSKYWSIDWCKVVRISDVGAGGERKAALVSADIQGVFNAHNGTAIGAIADPDGATKWPT